jgi:hypothetical protein
MKDFDASRNSRPRRPREDRMFILGGETFVARDRFRPEVLVPIESLEEPVLDHTTCSCEHRLYEHADANGRPAPCVSAGCGCQKFDAKVVDPGSSLITQLEALDTTIIGMIEPDDDAHARYRALRANEDDPLEVEDLMEVVKWCSAEDTGRPTMQPSVSTPGPVSTGTPSTDVSSSPVPAAA